MGLLLRSVSTGFCFIHLFERLISPTPSLFWDLIIYNAIVFTLTIALILEKKLWLAFGIMSWGASSAASSWFALFQLSNSPIFLDLGYVLYFPFALIFIVGSLGGVFKSKIYLLDASIIALGVASLLLAFALKPIPNLINQEDLRNVLNNFYPISDVILFAIAVTAVSKSKLSAANLSATLGFFIFALTDIKFFWISGNDEYAIGSWIESGWLIALILISLSAGKVVNKKNDYASFNQKMIFVAISLSLLTLGTLFILPNSVSNFAAIPATLTLIAAFLRMAIALKDAQSLGQAQKLAGTDELTGIANRRSLLSKLVELENTQIFSMLLLDLDSFKEINDGFGHDVGDSVLREVAYRFTQVLPADGFIARLGGDEFGILIKGDFEAAQTLSKRLELSLTTPFYLNQVPKYLSVSIGIAENSHGSDLIRAADLAMYAVKRAR